MKALLAALLLALASGAGAETLLSDTFSKPLSAGAPSAAWTVEAGSLSNKRGTGWSNSRTLRLLSRRDDLSSVAVSFQLLTREFLAGGTDEERPYDGVHAWLRYGSEESHYDAAVNRRDGTVAVKKMAGGALFTLGSAPFPVQLNSWQSVQVTVADERDGSVAISIYADGALLLRAADDGGQGGAPLRAPGRVGLHADNVELHLADFRVEALGAAAAPSVMLASATVRGPQAQITWRTPAEADSLVEFGPTAAYGARLLGGLGRDHAVALAGLAPGTLYHYHARSRGPSYEADSGDQTFQVGAAVDVSSPTVALTSPANGQGLSGSVTLTATAADDVGVAGVRFYLDAVPLGAEIAKPPYSLSFNTSGVLAGTHTLMVTARDDAGNRGEMSVQVAIGVAGAADAAAGAISNVFTQPGAAVGTPPAATVGGAGAAASSGPAPALAADAAGDRSQPVIPAPTPPAAAALSQAMSAPADRVRAAEKFLTPALADGINDLAHFGAEAAEVTIFDIRGRKIFHALRQGAAGLTWNGRDHAGRLVESGVYIARIIKADGKAVYQSLAVAK